MESGVRRDIEIILERSSYLLVNYLVMFVIYKSDYDQLAVD